MSSANLVREIHQKLCEKRALSTGELSTCEYVTLLQSFHRGTLSLHWYIAQNVQPTLEQQTWKFSVSLDKDFMIRFHIYFLLVLLFISSFQIRMLN